MSGLKPSATVFFTDVLTDHAFRAFFALLLAGGIFWGATSKVGIASRHFQAWSDLGLLTLMPTIGTLELILAVALIPRRTRVAALAVAVAYQITWMVASIQIDNWLHVFRSAGLLLLALSALFYGRWPGRKRAAG